MANVVRFKKRGVTASLENHYARIYSQQDGRIIYAGNGLNSDAEGNATVDIGEAGVHGQHVMGFAGDTSDFVYAMGAAQVSDENYAPGDAPLNTQGASISQSSVEEGESVSARKGNWISDDSIIYSYQWKLNGSNIDGATSGSILTDESMAGGTLTCVITATNEYGSTISETNPVSVVGEGGGPVIPVEPVSYVANLDGNQAWVMSEQLIDVDNLDGLSLKGNFPTGAGIYFSNGTGSDFRIYEDGTTGSLTAQIGGNYTADFGDSIAGEVEFRFTETNLIYLVDGVELSNVTYSKGTAKSSSPTVLFGRINSDGSVGQAKSGVVKDVTISKSGTVLFDSKLTDKDAGAAQLSTAGDVTATLENYDESVWIPYIPVPQYANLNGTNQAWTFGEKLIDVDDLDGTEIEAHFFEDSEGTLIAQSLGGSSEREFQYYKFDGVLGLRIGGQVDDLKLGDYATLGVHKLSFSGGNVVITINGIEIYDGTYADGGNREAGAVTTLNKRGGGNNKSGGVADFIIRKNGTAVYENTLTNRDEFGVNTPIVGTALATLENFTPDVWVNRFVTDNDIPTDKFIVFLGASIMERSFDQTSRTEGIYSAAGLDITTFCRALGGDTSVNTYIKAKELESEFSMVTKERYAFEHTGGNDSTLFGPYPGGADDLAVNVEGIAQALKSYGFKLIMTPISYRIPPASNPTAPYNTNIVDALVTQYADHQVDMYTFTLTSGDAYFGTGGGDGIHPSNPDGEVLTINYVVDNTVAYIQAS